LDRDIAAWFAYRFADRSERFAVVLSTTILRSSIMFFDDGRNEQELILEERPVINSVDIWEHQNEIREAYSRVDARKPRSAGDLLRNR
jgi:hypothetical protein